MRSAYRHLKTTSWMHDKVQHHHSEDLVNPIMPIAVSLNEYRYPESSSATHLMNTLRRLIAP